MSYRIFCRLRLSFARAVTLLAGLAVCLGTAAAASEVKLSVQRRDDGGTPVREIVRIDPAKTVVVVVDMWDRHWCKTFTARVGNMVGRMNLALDAVRKLGGQVDRLEERSDNWECDESAIWSPKKYARGVAEEAKADIERMVKQAVKNDIQPLVRRHVNQAQSAVEDDLEDVLDVLSRAGLGSVATLRTKLGTQVLDGAFGRGMNDVTDGAGTAAAVTAAISAVVGYVIADVILFYVLGLISGFLNPFLLAAAAVVGIVVLFAGEGVVKGWIRGKIAEKLQEKLGSSEVNGKIASAARKATEEQMKKLAAEYGTQLEALIKRAKDKLGRSSTKANKEQSRHKRATTSRRKAREALTRLVRELDQRTKELKRGVNRGKG